jgi:hypothetical protein
MTIKRKYKGAIITAQTVAPNSQIASGLWSQPDVFQAMSTKVWPGLQYLINFLVVGGGGGGSQGGGGAGGLVIGTTLVNVGNQVTITVGNGGLGVINSPNGYNGGNSSIVYSTSINIIGLGGGGGGASNTTGSNGGSGGGGGGNSGGSTSFGLALQPTQTQTTVNGTYTNYGNNGVGNQSASAPYPTGGGGGAGGSPSSSNAPGGAGFVSAFTGLPITYATGGAGTNYFNGATGANASVNTGNGGGGASANNNTQAGNGGSGIVIISYQSPVQKATGGVINTYIIGSLLYWTHTFIISGTFTA